MFLVLLVAWQKKKSINPNEQEDVGKGVGLSSERLQDGAETCLPDHLLPGKKEGMTYAPLSEQHA